jgi:tetratricopeptide (TPR) repeat protein
MSTVVIAVGTLAMVMMLFACTSLSSQAADLERRGDIDGAETLYREALADDPNNVEALVGLASALMVQKRYDEALPLQEQAVALDSSDAQTRVELGFNYLNHQARPADAVEAFSQAVLLDPSAKNLTFLAQAQREKGTFAEAESSLRRAMGEDKSYVYSYVVLIRLLEESGRGNDVAQVKAQAEANGVDLSGVSQGDQ